VVVASPAAVDGFEGSPDEILSFWEIRAGIWHSVGSPWRPSADDIAAYRRLAGSRLAGRVLVLGVTPELRDLVAEAGGRALVLDVSPAMYAAAAALLQHADPADETWVQQDWCDASLPAGEFDLVVGDMVWWAVSVSTQHLLRDAIHAALKPDGRLISRFRFTDPTRAGQSATSAIRHYLRLIDDDWAGEQVLRGALYSWLYDHTADGRAKRIDQRRAQALVLDIAATPEFTRNEAYLRGLADRLGGPNWTSQSRAELLDIVRAKFKVEREEHAGDYDSVFYPVCALKPKLR
jgi:SAM-dependent methyltransferase